MVKKKNKVPKVPNGSHKDRYSTASAAEGRKGIILVEHFLDC